jgi:hypothetical protein
LGSGLNARIGKRCFVSFKYTIINEGDLHGSLELPKMQAITDFIPDENSVDMKGEKYGKKVTV